MVALTVDTHVCNLYVFTTGPAPVDLLEALWLAGEMDGLTLVWKEGMSGYLPVSQVRECVRTEKCLRVLVAHLYHRACYFPRILDLLIAHLALLIACQRMFGNR